VLKPVPALKPGFDLDVAAMLAAIGPSTRVIIINSPNNPTGCVYSQATLARLAAGLEQVNRNRERPVFLLSDEPYRFLTYDGVVVPPILPLSPFAVVVGSFSKRLSIAGERIGYLAINPGMPDGGLLMQAVAMTTRTLGFVNAPVIGQKLALMLLNEGVDLGIYAHRRALMAQVLDAAGISYTMPQGAFYFYPAAPGGDDLAFVQHLLAENILAVPGREYGLADMIKLDFAKTFRYALEEMIHAPGVTPSVDELWRRFHGHLKRAVEVIAEGVDLHIEHMHEVFPELVLDLFCHGPVERGVDASHGGVEIINIGVDGSSLATVADSFAALEERVEREGRFTWHEMWEHLETNWEGPGGEQARQLMRNIRRFGSGDSVADGWAKRISKAFTAMVVEKPTPNGHRMVPGLFTWALTVAFGQRLGATPNGRRAGEPVSHGPNPEPGFNGGQPGTPTQMAVAVAGVQPGFGNTAPLQLDMDPGMVSGPAGVAKVAALIRGHFDLGGTMINMNIVDRNTILAAAENPAAYPDLIVRITGFSAYFASLSDELRQYVVDRVVLEA